MVNYVYKLKFSSSANIQVNLSSLQKAENLLSHYAYNNYDSISKPGFAFNANVALFPCSYAIVPAAAIIAALSVHKDNGGIISFTSFLFANSSSNRARNPLFAATPPARRRGRGEARRPGAVRASSRGERLRFA